ncbi:MAG: PocR ligand-binding domain-containing protein, partial [Desulforhabdus sp.]|nr:PocR ligand-binding domain-containing protein [Desulforhabdus sp.]
LRLALQGQTNRSSDVFGDVVLETVYAPYFAPDGRKIGVISIALDITERVRAETAARESQEKLAVALEGADLGSWNWNVQSGEINFDERWAGMLGYHVDEIKPHVKSWEALVHPEDLPKAMEALNDHLEGRTPFYETEHRLRHKSGTWVWVLDRGRVIDRDHDGRPIRAAGTHLNISERKRAEEALEKRLVALTRPLDSAEDIAPEDLFDLADLQRLQDLFADAFGVAALMTTPDGKPILQPSNFSDLCLNIRKTPKGLENCNYSDAMIGRHNPSGPNIQPCLSAGLCNAGASITVGGRHIANWLIGQVRNEAQKEEEIIKYAREIGVDEETFRTVYRKVPVMSQEQFDKTARILFELANQISRTAYQNVQQARFITERKQAEEALRKYERIVSTSLDLMALINRNYIYEAVNDSMLKAFNKQRREVVGHMVPECIGERVFREKIQPRIDLALSGQTVHFEETLEFAGIGRTPLDIRYFPLYNEVGEVGGVVLNARDISDRRRLEEQLLHSQKIESIGTLAGGVAHEINNPINGIMNYAQLILDGTEGENPARIYAEEIVHETQRVAKIVRNLLTFARDEKQSHSPALLSDIVSSVLSLIQTLIRRDQIDLQLEIPDDLPKIKCRSQQIQQVLMNLMTNARDALNERYAGYSEKKKLALRAKFIDKQGRRFIRTTVEDTGKGIPSEILDRIFDPIFTTKPKEIGTGLGLSISYGIVKDHGGELSVESEPGGYTRFHMDLPVDNGWTLSAKTT